MPRCWCNRLRCLDIALDSKFFILFISLSLQLGWLTWQLKSVCLFVCLCVNHGGTNHNCYTQRLVILYGDCTPILDNSCEHSHMGIPMQFPHRTVLDKSDFLQYHTQSPCILHPIRVMYLFAYLIFFSIFFYTVTHLMHLVAWFLFISGTYFCRDRQVQA